MKVKLAGGQKLSGVIGAVRDDGFTLEPKNGTPSQIAYGDVAQLRLSSRRYTAHHSAEPEAARRVVMALGVGQHIMVNPKGAPRFTATFRKLRPTSSP